MRNTKKTLRIPISIGELFDKISILEIKQQKIQDKQKLKNIQKEYKLLTDIAIDFSINLKNSNYIKLKKVNEILWEVEEYKRKFEILKKFDDEFIHLARQVYLQNDKRAKIKKAINIKYGSEIIEEKSYK